MMRSSEVEPQSTPPDRPGWWVLQVSARQQPLTLYLEDAYLTIWAARWQPSFRCWPLEQLLETPGALTVIQRIQAHPDLMWEIVRFMRHVRVLGPWEIDDVHGQVIRRAGDGSVALTLWWGALEDEEGADEAWCWVAVNGRAKGSDPDRLSAALSAEVAFAEQGWHVIPSDLPEMP